MIRYVDFLSIFFQILLSPLMKTAPSVTDLIYEPPTPTRYLNQHIIDLTGFSS